MHPGKPLRKPVVLVDPSACDRPPVVAAISRTDDHNSSDGDGGILVIMKSPTAVPSGIFHDDHSNQHHQQQHHHPDPPLFSAVAAGSTTSNRDSPVSSSRPPSIPSPPSSRGGSRPQASASAATHNAAAALYSSVASPSAAKTPRFPLPPALPPLPASPTQQMHTLTIEQARLRSTIQQACTALAASLAKEARRNPAAGPPPELQIGLFENDACTWLFRQPSTGGGGGGPSSTAATAGGAGSGVIASMSMSTVAAASNFGSNSIALDSGSAGDQLALSTMTPGQQQQQQPKPPQQFLGVSRETSDASQATAKAGGIAAARKVSFCSPQQVRKLQHSGSGSATGNDNNNNNNNNNQQHQHQQQQQIQTWPVFNTTPQLISTSLSDQQIEARVSRVADTLASEFILPTGETKGDIRTFRTRVKAAFAQQARLFQRKLREGDAAAATLQAQLARFEEGGDQQRQWAARLAEEQSIVARQDEKIKSLVKLLERTGVAMKKLERRLADMRVREPKPQVPQSLLQQQHHHQHHAGARAVALTSNTARSAWSSAANLFDNNNNNNNASTTHNMSFVGTSSSAVATSPGDGNSAQRHSRARQRSTFFGGAAVDWSPLYEQCRNAFDPEHHDNATIVRDIVEYILNLQEQVQDLEVQYDTAVERFGEKDKDCNALKKQSAALAGKLDEADVLMDGMLADIRKLQDEQEAADFAMETKRKELGNEKEMLQRRVIELEGNIAKSVEAKPFFVGLGRSLAVLPFLRYEGRVKNLDLPKADVEAVIQRIWAKRDPNRESLRRSQNAIIVHLNAAYPGHAVLELPQGGREMLNVAPEDEISELTDYDNVKFVRRTGTNFIDFVTQLLLDKSSSLLYGGEAFDFDPSALTNQQHNTGSAAAASKLKFAVAGTAARIAHKMQTAAASSSIHVTNTSGESGAGSNISVNAASFEASSGGAAAASSSSNLGVAGGGASSNSSSKKPVRARTKSQVLRKGEQLRGASRDWKNNPSFSVPTDVAEIAYSLMEGMERFKYDADIELFRAIVREEVSELAWFDQMVMLCKLKATLLQAGRMRSGKTGTATVSVILQTLYSFFPCKDKESFTFLRNALLMEARIVRNTADPDELEEELLTTPLSIEGLFESNEHGNQGMFAEKVRDQHLEESLLYSAELSTAASMCADTKTGRAPIRDIRAALQEVDPTKPVEEVDDFIKKVVAILQDEDGVDPFEVAPQSVGSSPSPTPAPGMFLGDPQPPPSGRASPMMSTAAASASDKKNRKMSNHFLSAGANSWQSSGTGALQKTGSTNFGAHDLLIMLEEGRRLKTVSDTDYVDCERFAAACRGVFSKRFGMRAKELAMEQSQSMGAVQRVRSVAIFEQHESNRSTWQASISTSDAIANSGGTSPGITYSSVGGGGGGFGSAMSSSRRGSVLFDGVGGLGGGGIASVAIGSRRGSLRLVGDTTAESGDGSRRGSLSRVNSTVGAGSRRTSGSLTPTEAEKAIWKAEIRKSSLRKRPLQEETEGGKKSSFRDVPRAIEMEISGDFTSAFSGDDTKRKDDGNDDDDSFETTQKATGINNDGGSDTTKIDHHDVPYVAEGGEEDEEEEKGSK